MSEYFLAGLKDGGASIELSAWEKTRTSLLTFTHNQEPALVYIVWNFNQHCLK